MFGASYGNFVFLIAACMMRGKYGAVLISVHVLIFWQVYLTWFDL